MTKVLGVNCGSVDGSTHALLIEALRAAEADGCEVVSVWLDGLRLPTGTDPREPDDAWWFWEQLMDCDALIVSSPIISRTVPGRVKVLADRLMGPNADRAIIETMVAMRDAGEEPKVPFRLDERVLRPRVAGFIACGGAIPRRWQALALPVMHILTFSMHTAVVDQMLVAGAGTPKSVVIVDGALERAARLGHNVAAQAGRSFDEAEYVGEPGLCPMCHLDVIVLQGSDVECATCGARGRLVDAQGGVEWTDLTASVISMHEKREHYQEILDTAARHAKQREEIEEQSAAYAGWDRSLTPPSPS